MHTGRGTIHDFGNGFGECCDLGLDLRTGRSLPLEKGNKNGQFTGVNGNVVLRVLIARKLAETNPRLTRRRVEDATNRGSKRARQIIRDRAISVGDEFDCDDWHAERPSYPARRRHRRKDGDSSPAGDGSALNTRLAITAYRLQRIAHQAA